MMGSIVVYPTVYDDREVALNVDNGIKRRDLVKLGKHLHGFLRDIASPRQSPAGVTFPALWGTQRSMPQWRINRRTFLFLR